MPGPKKKATARRVQYAALPFRRRALSRVQVMLVTSRETGRWIIPKGWPMKRKAPHTSAAREALEEAGVVGTVGRESVGTYSYKKRLSNGAIVTCEVRVFPLEVKRQEKQWLEKAEREFHWFSSTGAAKAVQEPALSDIIRSFSKRKQPH
jgi:8-oxo-dGTP pyrophosphatase MutT (NUDIX family)